MSPIDPYLHTIMVQGEVEARRDGSDALEAHHLLLAIAAQEGTIPQQVLASAGLDHQSIRDALDKEFEHSLSAAGVSLADFTLPRPSIDLARRISVGASTRLALERGVFNSKKKDLQPAHVLLGILRAEVGTVPRALALAGIDQANLMTRVMETLD